jgi:predicted DNA-binding transcriptional regulator AlpA
VAKRLIDWRTIQREKIARSRSWIFRELREGRFPKPAVSNPAGGETNLWNEADVDAWLERFVEDRAEKAKVTPKRDGLRRRASSAPT